jgi:NhaA family Na+:H+ antiporter
VTVGGLSGLVGALSDRVALGVAVGLLVGKAIGISGGTWLVARFTRARLDEQLGWADVAGLSLLGGIGFTVSLLIGELAFGGDSARGAHAKVGVLAGTVSAAVVAAVVLRLRNRRYRRICAEESLDTDADGVPDVFETDFSDG